MYHILYRKTLFCKSMTLQVEEECLNEYLLYSYFRKFLGSQNELQQERGVYR